jgi:hypothetical protein
MHTGWDYGLVYGVGYSHQLISRLPVLLNTSYTFPSGERLVDDYKARMGGQIRLHRLGYFQSSVSLHGIYRRYENPLVRLQNIGFEMAGVIGYYRPRWFVGGEVGIDKAIKTHFSHSRIYKQSIYLGVRDGWSRSASGGNYNFGIQAGHSFRQSDIVFKIGKVISQDLITKPMIPYYLELGYVCKVKGKE